MQQMMFLFVKHTNQLEILDIFKSILDMLHSYKRIQHQVQRGNNKELHLYNHYHSTVSSSAQI